MKVDKKFVLIKFECDKVNQTYEVRLNQGRKSLSYGVCDNAYSMYFKSESEAMEYMVENQLFGDWICVPLFTLDTFSE